MPPRKCPNAPKENFTGETIQGKETKENHGREAQPKKITPSTSNTVALASVCVPARNTVTACVKAVVSGGSCFYGIHVLIENMLLGATY